MKDLIRTFKRIPESTRTIVYGIMSLFKNLFSFSFKIIVGIIFKTPLLIAIAIYNLLIGLVKANCSRGLLKNKDDLKDCKTYIAGGVVLLLSSICYIIYTANLVGNPYNMQYTVLIAVAIAAFAAYRMTVSICGLVRIKGKTLLVKEFKLTNFAIALTNLVLTQIAILSFMPVENMYFYNSLLGVIVGVIILGFALYLVISGLVKLKVYTTGITNSKKSNSENTITETHEKTN